MADEKKTLEDEIRATLDEIEGGEDETEEGVEGAAEEVAEEVTDETTEETTEEAAEEETTAEEPLAAPDHWPTAEKELFTGLPKEAQEAVLERSSALERSHHERLRHNEDQVRLADEIISLYEPVQDRLRLNGLTIPQVTAQLLQTYQVLLSNPDNAYGLLGQSYKPQNPGQTLQGLATAWGVALQQNEAEEMLDPVANQEIQQLKAQLSTLTSQITQQQTQAQTTQQTEAQRLWDDFVGAKDDKGALKFPHVDKLQTEIAALLRSGVTSLEDAYESATWTNPNIRAEMMKTQQVKSETKRKESVAKAKKAAKNPKSDTALVSAEKPVPKTLRDTIKAAADEVEARA